jgi:hypothetical protein
MQVSERAPNVLEVEDAAERILPEVLDYLLEHPGEGGN